MKKFICMCSVALSVSIICSAGAFAGSYIYESYVSLATNVYEFFEDSPGAQFGASVVYGDFNDDGIDDLIVGSPFFSSGVKEWHGKVSVYLGTPYKQPYIRPDFQFFGAFAGDQLGTSLAVGDFNGDGVDDLAMGAHNAYFSDYRPGKVYVMYGRSNWKRKVFDFNSYKPDFLITGKDDRGGFGMTLFSSDITGDGVSDLFVGAPSASPPGCRNCGSVYGFTGGLNEKNNSIYNLRTNDADIVFYGQESNEKFGSSISGGVITSDGFSSIIIGAFRANAEELLNAGKVYVYKNFLYTNAVADSPQLILSGSAQNEWFGFALSTGDIDGDGILDIAISSFPYADKALSGKVKVFFGADELFSVGEQKGKNVSVSGSSTFGSAVLLEDMNRDSKADIIVGSPDTRAILGANPGNVYIGYADTKNSLKIDSIINGEKADDWFGYSFTALDFNNDGFQDLAIGARYADGDEAINTGKVYLFYGTGQPFGNIRYVSEIGSDPSENVTRGEFVSYIFKKFDLRAKNSNLLKNCYSYPDFCLFNFMAKSSFAGISFNPEFILYPDVSSDHENYDDINTATMLGIVNGFMSLENSPFRPDDPITKIQALKVILSADGLVDFKYRFELENELGGAGGVLRQVSGFADVNPEIDHMWWYPRYTHFALSNAIIEDSNNFFPDENITLNELEIWVKNTLALLGSMNS